MLYFVVTALPKAVLTTDDPEQVPVPKTPVVAKATVLNWPAAVPPISAPVTELIEMPVVAWLILFP